MDMMIYAEATGGALAQHPWLSAGALASAAVAALILIWYLGWRPPLTRITKVILLFGIGILPVGAAMLGDIVTFEQTKHRHFCGSCHVMLPFTRDAADISGQSLASQHSQNPWFGEESCYVCHTDYVMFGKVLTKISGLRHVWEYYTEYRTLSVRRSLDRIHLYRPYRNSNCMQCHSTKLPGWADVADHVSLERELRSGAVSCASEGCHGPVHAVGPHRHFARTEGRP